MNTFEITIQRKSKESRPIVVERSQPCVLLPIRSLGTFQLTTTDFEELQSLQRQPEEYGILRFWPPAKVPVPKPKGR